MSKQFNPQEKIEVSMTMLQYTLLHRLFNINGKMKDELRQTDAYKQMTGTGESKGVDLTTHANKFLNNDTFYDIFRKVRPRGFDLYGSTFEEPIKVGEYDVEFKEGGVQVGCTFVDKKTILDIAAKMK